MPLHYWVFDPSPCHFPKPRVPVLPGTFERMAGSESMAQRGQRRLEGATRHFSHGRYALGEAYRLGGLDQNSALMAPAYHCVTMLDPALALGADVQLYPLTAGLSPDPDKLNEIFAQSAKPIKVLLATHFFGFVQDLSWLKQWCAEKGVTLVEDCSHVLFNEHYQAEGAGRFGKFIASSPYKFFPSVDGGLLYAPEARLLDGLATLPAAWLAELRGIKRSFEHSRIPRILKRDIDQVEQQLDAVTQASLVPGVDRNLQRQAQSTQYSEGATRFASLRSSRWVIDHSSIGGNVTRRQANYRRWLQALADVPNCHALYPDLPDHFVPYMFPLYVDFPMPHFYWLKQMGVPVWRWDEMAVSTCPVARDYRLHLLHLPCHQSLSEDELNWIVAATQKTLGRPVDGVHE